MGVLERVVEDPVELEDGGGESPALIRRA